MQDYNLPEQKPTTPSSDLSQVLAFSFGYWFWDIVFFAVMWCNAWAIRFS